MPRNILPEAAEKGSLDSTLRTLQMEISTAISGFPAEKWGVHPPGKWCAAEILEHLYLSYTGTIRGFEHTLKAGRPLGTRATVRQRIFTLVVVGFGHMPTGEAPAVARPRGLAREKVLAEIGGKIEEMDAAIRRGEEKHGTQVKLLDHPILGPLTGPQWRKLHLVHGRHHLKQIRALGEMAVVGA